MALPSSGRRRSLLLLTAAMLGLISVLLLCLWAQLMSAGVDDDVEQPFLQEYSAPHTMPEPSTHASAANSAKLPARPTPVAASPPVAAADAADALLQLGTLMAAAMDDSPQPEPAQEEVAAQPAATAAAVAGEAAVVAPEASSSARPSAAPRTAAPPSAQTAAERVCSQRIGTGLVQQWMESVSDFISPLSEPSAASAVSLPGRWSSAVSVASGALQCGSMTIPDMPGPTAPHSFCRASHLLLFVSSFTPAQAPRYRPNYAFGSMQHFQYPDASLAVLGSEARPQRRLDLICNDHMKDSIAATAAVPDREQLLGRLQALTAEQRLGLCSNCTLLLVTREGGEHVNLFHTMTDWYNTFLMLRAHNLTTAPALHNVRLLLLDAHPAGYLDPLWQSVFSPAAPVMTVRNLTGQGVALLSTPSALWVPAGYSSPLWIHLRSEDECKDAVDSVAAFAHFVKKRLRVVDRPLSMDTIHTYFPHFSNTKLSGSSCPYRGGLISQHTVAFPRVSSASPPGVLHLVLISRRPYKNAAVDHATINRRILNEDDLLQALLLAPSQLGNVSVPFSHLHLSFVDFARLHITEQIRLVSSCDVLMGMHGAALSHAVFLPARGALIELQPRAQDWRIFQHMQQWAHRSELQLLDSGQEEDWQRLDGAHGSNYGEWRNTDLGREKKDAVGDGVEVDVEGVRRELLRLIRWRTWKELQQHHAAPHSPQPQHS